MSSAVLEFSRLRFTGLARKVIYHLQRRPASGVYGDYRYKTLWDEYCHGVQKGPIGALEWAWESALHPICDEIISRLPPAEKKVLYFGTHSQLLDSDIDAGDMALIDNDALRDELLSSVNKVAASRDLQRFWD